MRKINTGIVFLESFESSFFSSGINEVLSYHTPVSYTHLGATALANAETYTVQKGDTLSAIAKKNGTTVDEIVSKNGIQDANKISIGQNLTINETTEETTEPSATTEAAVESTQSTESTQSEDTQATNTNLSSSEAAAKEEIAQRESSGSYTCLLYTSRCV